MRVIVDLPKDVLEKLEGQARVWKRSRKSHLEYILTEQSASYDMTIKYVGDEQPNYLDCVEQVEKPAEPTASQESIKKQIAAILKEPCPPERNTAFGKKIWQAEQRKRIESLKSQMKP
jgi:hypothetical protein